MLWLVLMPETWSAEMQGAGKETHEDVDVSAERRRIEEGGADHDSLCLKKLHKAYETKASCFLHTCALYPPDLVILGYSAPVSGLQTQLVIIAPSESLAKQWPQPEVLGGVALQRQQTYSFFDTQHISLNKQLLLLVAGSSQ